MKSKLTLPTLFFGVFAFIIIGLGVRKYLENQAAIAKWDIDHAEETEEIRKMFEGVR
ncbi:hypothetical protein N8920_01110 [Opitutales bacterium]|nr:hypothetical protein [Opitutales bacterium]MDA8991634.1 hypothetical protein [Opitutales bacterium]